MERSLALACRDREIRRFRVRLDQGLDPGRFGARASDNEQDSRIRSEHDLDIVLLVLSGRLAADQLDART